jgi:PAS domain S-box-containing protein
MEALELVKERYPFIPFIIVTGSINEATAVECMKAGADDYVLKEGLKHIGPAVEGALEKKRLREKKEKAEEIVRQSAREWQTTFDAVNDAISLINMEGKILQCNKAMASLLGKTAHEIMGSTCWELVHNTSEPIEGCPFIRMRETNQRETTRLPSGDRMLQVTVDPVLDDDGDLISGVHIISDITALNRAEEQQKNLISELQNAFAKVKQLSGFLPICASCKKIRDDKGYWNQIENYIRDHSEADFSHGICPECAKNLYPGLELSFKGNDS